MSNPQHSLSFEKLPPDLHAEARKLIAARGMGKTVVVLRTTEATLLKLLDGAGLTRRTRDRIANRIREVSTVRAELTAASFESSGEDGQARGMFMHAKVSGCDAETAGDLLGMALGMASGIGQ